MPMDDDLVKSNDPKLLVSRLFVGSWPDSANRQDLIDMFCTFGNILGIHILKGFAFVQFEKEADLHKAIKAVDKKHFKSSILKLKPAKMQNDNSSGQPPFKRRFQDEQNSRFNPSGPPQDFQRLMNLMDSGPMQPYFNGPPPADMGGQYFGGPPRHNMDGGPSFYGGPPPSLMGGGGGPPFFNDRPPMFYDGPPPMGMGPPNDMQGGMMGPMMMGGPPGQGPNFSGSGSNLMPLMGGFQQPGPFQNDNLGNGFQSQNNNSGTSSAIIPANVPPLPTSSAGETSFSEETGKERKLKKCDLTIERPFDAVIVVTRKELKHYAEMVERRLLELNLVVDMIFLLNEKALNKAIDDMTCRGVLYVLVVQQQHEQRKSITVNIMHGTPQEHRNMPLEDAVVMLAKNFNSYLSSLRIGGEQPTMGFLLSLLAEGKNLSVAELDRIITHLNDRRDRMIEAEGGRRDSNPKVDNNVLLQQKILSIVSQAILSNPANNSQNSGKDSLAQKSTMPPTTQLANLAQQFGLNLNGQLQKQSATTTGLNAPAMAAPQSLNLTDPSLKKTLDSLLQNPNLFKNLNPTNSGGSSTTPTPPPQQQAWFGSR